ncbi:MAG: Lrp/AsnC ligand binding domain-containing protein [Candidatus Bathyarchaeota archaeon]|nr:Lrp/AsnC ligand binding domain-containing protein [Candidatus Bathyarchaeota archaeon]
MLSACVLIRTVHGKFDNVVASIRQLKAAKRVFPTLGRYDAVVDLEAANLQELNSTVLRLGCIAGVVFTETLVEIQQEA